MELFRFQAEQNALYKSFLAALNVAPSSIKKVQEIPFLPIELFKHHEVVTAPATAETAEKVFTSSGTTGANTSCHFVHELAVYEQSFLHGFQHFYGNPEAYCILALLPAYLERSGSSLVYMAQQLIERSGHASSGFYLHNISDLVATLARLEAAKTPTLLLGVTFALLDLAADNELELRHTVVMETGGMKGRRKEMVREEVHKLLSSGLGVAHVHSEYGMTELLSQAYSKGNGVFRCPPWMQVLARDTSDPRTMQPAGRTGGLNVIDLANVYSCAFLATQDLGRVYADGSFEVLGRFDNSDLRGCSLLTA